MPTIDFLKHLNRKLKTGNLRSIHLNALPGRYATRLDFKKLDIINNTLASDFLELLLDKPNFKFTISFDKINLNNLDEDEQDELNFIVKKLNGINYQNNDNFLEHGIKTFGFGFPILIKRDKKDPSKIIKAPLIIWHLDIEKSSRKTNEWKIIKDEDYPITLNEVLISHIEQDEDITIRKLTSEYLEDGIIDRNEVIQISKEVFNQLNVLEGNEDFNTHITSCPNREKIENITGNIPWICWSGIFGLFRAQKESIITDIDKLIEDYDSFEFEKLKVETYQTSTIASVETDPSQEEILNSLTKKSTRIIQGPPGTGKSQSLTAIITNALENGAKCLVVCEKKTALDVIYNNLSELGLGGLCSVIDDVSKDRKKIIDRVRTVIEEVKYHFHTFREQEYSSNLKLYEDLRNVINHKHRAVLSKIFGDDKWKDIIGRYIAKEKIESKEVLKKRLNKENYEHRFEEFQELAKAVQDGKFLYEEINTLHHPLGILNDDIFDGHYLNTTKTDIEAELKELADICSKRLSEIQDNIDNYGKRFTENSGLHKNLIGLFSIFSLNYKELKAKRHKTQKKYQEFTKSHEIMSYFPFNFMQLKSLKNYSEIEVNLNSYEKLISNLLKEFNVFQEFFEWKSFLLSLLVCTIFCA